MYESFVYVVAAERVEDTEDHLILAASNPLLPRRALDIRSGNRLKCHR